MGLHRPPFAFTEHGALAANTRSQFNEVIDALRALMTPAEPKRRPIGFVTQEEK